MSGKIDTNPRIIKRQNSYAVVVDLGVYPAEQEARDRSNTYCELDELEKFIQDEMRKPVSQRNPNGFKFRVGKL